MEKHSTKICTTCDNERSLTEFYKTNKIKSGIRSQCKYCEKEYYSKHKYKKQEYGKSYSKKYCKTEKGKAKSKNDGFKRRLLIKNSDVSTKDILKIQKDAKDCYWCGTSLHNKTIHIDHYVPISKGGLHKLSNLVVSCSRCNFSKGAKDPIEFANELGKLL